MDRGLECCWYRRSSLPMSNRYKLNIGIGSLVLLYICSFMAVSFNPRIDSLIGFGSSLIEEKKSRLTPQNLDTKEARQHKVAGLSCKAYGGPRDEDAAEMVYWKDIPVDATFISPFKRKEEQYLTFEPGTFVIYMIQDCINVQRYHGTDPNH